MLAQRTSLHLQRAKQGERRGRKKENRTRLPACVCVCVGRGRGNPFALWTMWKCQGDVLGRVGMELSHYHHYSQILLNTFYSHPVILPPTSEIDGRNRDIKQGPLPLIQYTAHPFLLLLFRVERQTTCDCFFIPVPRPDNNNNAVQERKLIDQ